MSAQLHLHEGLWFNRLGYTVAQSGSSILLQLSQMPMGLDGKMVNSYYFDIFVDDERRPISLLSPLRRPTIYYCHCSKLALQTGWSFFSLHLSPLSPFSPFSLSLNLIEENFYWVSIYFLSLSFYQLFFLRLLKCASLSKQLGFFILCHYTLSVVFIFFQKLSLDRPFNYPKVLFQIFFLRKHSFSFGFIF